MPKYISGLNGDGLLDEGDYPFKVTSARLKTSKAGAEMIEISMDVGENGNTVKINDYLVFSGKPFNSARIDQIRSAVGEIILPGEEIDVSPGDFMHKTGRAHVVIELWNNRKVNRIGSYLEPEDEIPGLTPAPKSKSK